MNAVQFSMKAPTLFSSSDPHAKRYVASKFATRYVLTLGKLEITPHPLISSLAALEPPKTPKDMVGAGALRPDAPLEWALRERIRTLLAGLTETDHCFADESFIKQPPNLVEIA
jgi:hypothetical protein